MSGFIKVPQLDAPEFAPGDVDGLLRFVWKRIAWEINHHHADGPHVYHPLNDRLVRAKRGVDMIGRQVPTIEGQKALWAEFEADLRELTTAPVEVLRAMVMRGATSARGMSPTIALQAHHAAMVAPAALRPQVSPAELVAQFAARGVIVRAVDGNLHVSPPEALTAADRDVLTNHKPGILAALAQPAAVL